VTAGTHDNTASRAGEHSPAGTPRRLARKSPVVRRPWRWTTPLAVTTIGLLVIAGGATYLLQTQRSAEQKLRQDFAKRTGLAARLTGSVFSTSGRQSRAYYRIRFAGAARNVQAVVDAEARTDPTGSLIVLGPGGEILGAFPHAFRRHANAFVKTARNAPESGKWWWSNVLGSPHGPVVLLTSRFSTKHGIRTVSASVPLGTVSDITKAYLATALGTSGGHTALVDASNSLIASSSSAHGAAKFADPQLRRALRTAPTGRTGETAYASAAVPGTRWRLVFTAPYNNLLAPIRSSKRVGWQLFSAFAIAILGLVGLAVIAVRRSEQLAHARLHDMLTGLPSRVLFITHAQRAIRELRHEGGQLAVLFIDLDRFKQVNDIHGHSVGDALLVAVGARLRACFRAGGTVSRFGGDEFLALCTALEDESQALQTAARIHDALSRPFRVSGTELTIGCSIGVAMLSVKSTRTDAAALIHDADLAMYRAKRDGRARPPHIAATKVVSVA
jgi:diguanylate cyclase (GGDEF)-like protein